MIETQQISTSSTLNEYQPAASKSLFDSLEEIEKCNECQKCTSKRFKNLVKCYLCKVDDCQILFETKEELSEHLKTHTHLYNCSFQNCQKSFMKLVNLRKHNKVHFKNRRRYYCPYEGCEKSFTASYSLTLHYRIHTGITPFECKKCGKKFFDRANYQYHVSNMHKSIMIKKLICPHKKCGHKSKSIKQLLMHHDKLEEQCIKEKNLLLKLIMFFQNATISLLNRENSKNKEIEEFEKQIGVDEEKKYFWRNAVDTFDLDNDLKSEIDLIDLHSRIVVNNSVDINKYKGILDSKATYK